MGDSPKIIVGLLFGGASRRMGKDKANLVLPSGQTLLERTCDVARGVSDRVVLLGGARIVPESLRAVPTLEDLYPGLGPMGGLQSALHAFPGSSVLLLACDLPRLDLELLRMLIQESSEDLDAVAFESPTRPGRLEPCCALYGPQIRPRVDRAIDAGNLSMHALIDTPRTRRIKVPPELADSLLNVNTPEDFDALPRADG